MSSNLCSDRGDAPIFVLGVSRSGTGLLRLMMNAHPNIYLSYEASFYLSEHDRTRLSSAEWLHRYFQTLQFAWLRVKPEEILGELRHPIPRHELHRAFDVLMRHLARRHQRRRHGDKTPRHAAYLPQIFRDFPDARVVHIVRDPRQTLRSLTSMPWGPASYLAATAFIARQLDAVVPFRDRIHELRLEDLLADPRAEMAKVLSFVGEPWDEAVLDHPRHAPTRDVPPLPWLAITKEPPRAQPAARHAPLPTGIRHLVEGWLGPAMGRYGYPRGPRGRAWPLQLAAGAVRDLPAAGGYLWRGLAYLRATRGRRRPDASTVQVRLLQLNPSARRTYPGMRVPDPPPVEKACRGAATGSMGCRSEGPGALVRWDPCEDLPAERVECGEQTSALVDELGGGGLVGVSRSPST